jgi:hypothetical protein
MTLLQSLKNAWSRLRTWWAAKEAETQAEEKDWDKSKDHRDWLDSSYGGGRKPDSKKD